VTVNSCLTVEDMEKRLPNMRTNDQVYICDFKLAPKDLRIGDLVGNRFSVLIRLLDYKKDSTE